MIRFSDSSSLRRTRSWRRTACQAFRDGCSSKTPTYFLGNSQALNPCMGVHRATAPISPTATDYLACLATGQPSIGFASSPMPSAVVQHGLYRRITAVSAEKGQFPPTPTAPSQRARHKQRRLIFRRNGLAARPRPCRQLFPAQAQLVRYQGRIDPRVAAFIAHSLASPLTSSRLDQELRLRARA